MKFEISKEQKEALGDKISLCVDFLKNEVQPHMVKSDMIAVAMGDDLELFVSREKIYVKGSVTVLPSMNLCNRKMFFLENPGRKKSKQYICEAQPELAVKFLQNWEQAKNHLLKHVDEKTKKFNDLNQFVDGFKL